MGDFSSSSQMQHFPQPTRPTCTIDVNPKIRVPENRFPQALHHPEAILQFPQPCKPVYSYNDDNVPPQSSGSVHDRYQYSSSSSASFASFESNATERCSYSESTLAPPSEATPKAEVEAVDELLQILIECLDELNTKSRELLLRKFFSEIEKETSLERFIVERLKNSKIRVISELLEKIPQGQVNSDAINVVDSMPTRSIYDSVEELSQKLEKFKVRTLDLGGISDDEGTKLEKFKVRTLDLGGGGGGGGVVKEENK